MIYVLATIEVTPGRREEFLEIFRENIPNVLAEDGCIEYVPACEVASEISLQAPPREQVVTVIEKWRDVAALEAHLQAPHMEMFRSRVQGIVQQVTLQILEPA